MRATTITTARVDATFGVLAFSAIFFQKFGLPIPGTNGAMSLDFLILWGVLFWLLLRGHAVVDPVRFVLFLGTVCAALLALVLEQRIYSVPALMLFLSTYAAVIIQVDVDKATVLRCMSRYQSLMCWVAVIVMIQQIIQFTIGPEFWPNLNTLVPESIILGGFAYLRPYDWPPAYYMPNGIFFLEPSVVSLFLSVSLVVEVVWFKRLERILLLGFTLFAAMIGTGILIIALLSPVLLLHTTKRLRRWIIFLMLPMLVLATNVGASHYLSSRTDELSSSDSSAYGRIVAPFERTMALLVDPSYLVTGDGPGSSPKDPVQWPADKLSYEYGNLTMLAFHVFILTAVFATAANRTVAMAVLLPNLFFGGGFGLASNVMMMIMFGSLLRLMPDTRDAVMLYPAESLPA